jgi:hypothetical protein
MVLVHRAAPHVNGYRLEGRVCVIGIVFKDVERQRLSSTLAFIVNCVLVAASKWAAYHPYCFGRKGTLLDAQRRSRQVLTPPPADLG